MYNFSCFLNFFWLNQRQRSLQNLIDSTLSKLEQHRSSQNCIIISQHQHCLVLVLLSISIAQHQDCLALALLSISIAQHQHCLALALTRIRISIRIPQQLGVRGWLCNPSYLDNGIRGLLEDRSSLPRGCFGPQSSWIYPRINSLPPRGYGLVLGAIWLSQGPFVRPNSRPAEFYASVVLNHSCYVVLGLNWPQYPSLIPGSLEFQLHG